MNTNDEKGALRPKFIGLLKSQKEHDRLLKSRLIADKLFALPVIQKASTILFYASFEGEVDTFAMMERAIQLKKRIALPIILRDQRKMIPTLTDNCQGLQQGVYGIRQPSLDASQEVEVSAIDAVIVPGLAFDRAKNRLGRGAGYYDRFLTGLSKHTETVGLAFDFQFVDCLPTEPHDIALTHIIVN